jgi:hypothetical protein
MSEFMLGFVFGAFIAWASATYFIERKYQKQEDYIRKYYKPSVDSKLWTSIVNLGEEE